MKETLSKGTVLTVNPINSDIFGGIKATPVLPTDLYPMKLTNITQSATNGAVGFIPTITFHLEYKDFKYSLRVRPYADTSFEEVTTRALNNLRQYSKLEGDPASWHGKSIKVYCLETDDKAQNYLSLYPTNKWLSARAIIQGTVEGPGEEVL